VCLAVIGRYFPSLRFLDVMLGSAPALALHERFYQRLLAGDVDENVRIADDYLEEQPIEALYDEVALPALALAAEDNRRGRLSRERRHIVMRSALRLVNELADHDQVQTENATKNGHDAAADVPSDVADDERFSVLCAAGRSPLDLAVAT